MQHIVIKHLRYAEVFQKPQYSVADTSEAYVSFNENFLQFSSYTPFTPDIHRYLPESNSVFTLSHITLWLFVSLLCWPASCCSFTKSCLTLCDPMDWSTPGFPIFHYLLEFAQNSCPLSWWWHPTISSSVTLFSSCHQSFPASGSFPVSQLFTSDGQSIEASVSASVLPVNIQGWFPLGLTGLISLLSKGLSRVFFSTTIQKHQFFGTQSTLWSNFHICTWLLKNKQTNKT